MVDITNIWPSWKVEGLLGSGDYSKLYKAVCRESGTERHAAIKVISISSEAFGVDPKKFTGLDGDYAKSQMQKTADGFISELRLLSSLKGYPGIVGVDDYKMVQKADELVWEIYIRTEPLTPFDLYVNQTEITEEAAIRFGLDICDAVEICRENGISYCDIVPENIFVDAAGRVKLGNFGIERRLNMLKSGITSKGTPGYAGSEKESGSAQSEQVGIYVLGMTMYRMLNGNVLPSFSQFGKSLPAPRGASPDMADVIRRACSFRFANVAELKQALADLEDRAYISARGSGVYSSGTVRQSIGTEGPVLKKKRKNPAIAAVCVVMVLVLIIATLSATLIGSLSKENPADDSDSSHTESNVADNPQTESNVAEQSGQQEDDIVTPDSDSQADEPSEPDEKQDDVQAEDRYIYLTDLDISDSSDGGGLTYYPAAIDNLGTRYSNGIGGSAANEQSWQEYKLDGEYTELRGRAILNYEFRTQSNDNVYLWIYGDDEQLYKSAQIKGGVFPQDFTVDITGVETLRIIIDGQNMVRLVDCALYKDSSVPTVSTAKEAKDDGKTQVRLYDLDWFNSSKAGGVYDYEPNAQDRNRNKYSGAFIGPIFGKGNWQDYYINGKYSEISGILARTDYAHSGDIFDNSPAQMKVYGDGVLLYETNIYNKSEAISFNVDITGIKVLRIYTNESGHFMIADCMLTK